MNTKRALQAYHPASMYGACESPEVTVTTKVRVKPVKILLPICTLD
jgi:hypothetical protein